MKTWKWSHIHELVQSLTPNEKRYFSMMQKMNGKEKNYLRLFEAINQQLSYHQIAEKFADTKVNVSYEKSYLTKMILKSLRNFHESSSIDKLIFQVLADIEILLDKKLYTFCLAYSEFYLELCKECELYEYQLLLLKGKRRCILRLGYIDKYAENIELERASEEECLQKLNNYSIYKKLHQKMHLICTRKKGVMNTEDKKLLHEIFKQPELENINLAQSFIAKMMFYDIKIWYYNYYEENYLAAYKFSAAKIELLENNTFVLKSSPLTYMSVYANHYIRAYALQKIDELPNIIERIDFIANHKSPFIAQDIKNEAFAHSSEKILDYCVATNQFEKGIHYYSQNKRRIQQQHFKLNAFFQMTQHYFAAYFYFHLKDYKNAIKQIKIVLDNFNPETRLVCYVCTKMMNILVQYELGNYDLIPYSLKSMERLLKSNNIQNKAFELTDTLLRKIITLHSKKEIQFHVNNYLMSLKSLKDYDESSFCKDSGLLYWAENQKI